MQTGTWMHLYLYNTYTDEHCINTDIQPIAQQTVDIHVVMPSEHIINIHIYILVYIKLDSLSCYDTW